MRYVLKPQADRYLRIRTDLLVREYLHNRLTRRDTDALRGMADALWHTDALSWEGYLFFRHFACWLDGDRKYGTHEERWCQEFVNITEEELREKGLLDEEDGDE